MTAPWLDDGDVALYHGSALEVLRSLPAGSVQTCVTSPPYWGLRDYGTGSWTGGDVDCDHAAPWKGGPPSSSTLVGTHHRAGYSADGQFKDECAKCGAQRVDAQLGLEPTPTMYVAALVAVFAEVWRVLRADGTLWLNLGDSYWNGGGEKRDGGHGFVDGGKPKLEAAKGSILQRRSHDDAFGLKAKDLVGVPWRVAFALQEAGWYLRSDIIWAKPNPMPESVTDRPTKAHEYVFLLAKQARYYFDADAIREPAEYGRRDWGSGRIDYDGGANGSRRAVTTSGSDPEAGRNARSVWEIATQPTPEAHFATYPEALVRRCILAGTSEHGGCAKCGAPWQRQTERTPMVLERSTRTHPMGRTRSSGTMVEPPTSTTTGWAPSCQCGAPAAPQTVLDPFVGSGTTALVARKHGRRAVGVDLSADYLAIAARRLGQQSLFATSEGAA